LCGTRDRFVVKHPSIIWASGNLVAATIEYRPASSCAPGLNLRSLESGVAFASILTQAESSKLSLEDRIVRELVRGNFSGPRHLRLPIMLSILLSIPATSETLPTANTPLWWADGCGKNNAWQKVPVSASIGQSRESGRRGTKKSLTRSACPKYQTVETLSTGPTR
jgi:hypothetical protein